MAFINGKIRLIYFPKQGRAEHPRWILSYAQADWEDVRIGYDEWPNMKSTSMMMRKGQLPVMEWTSTMDGKVHLLSQSAAIVRALASNFNLLPKTPQGIIEADEAFETMKDAALVSYVARYDEDLAKRDRAMQHLVNNVFPTTIAFLESKLQANGGKFIAGGENVGSSSEIFLMFILFSSSNFKFNSIHIATLSLPVSVSR